MNGNKAIRPIPAVQQYFKSGSEIPTIVQEFRTRKGWIRTVHRKRVSAAWLRKLRREGVTYVALESEGRIADFSIEELLRSAAKGASK